MTVKCKMSYFFATLIGVLLLDGFSKYWVHHHIPLMSQSSSTYPYGGIPVFENLFGVEFSISHLVNYGAAWGMFEGFQNFLLIIRIVLILAMIVYFLRISLKSSHGLFRQLPLVLIIAGATGNVLDTFLYGHVVDMLHFVFWGYDFPVFNLADSAVTVGAFWLICISMQEEKPEISNGMVDQ